MVTDSIITWALPSYPLNAKVFPPMLNQYLS